MVTMQQRVAWKLLKSALTAACNLREDSSFAHAVNLAGKVSHEDVKRYTRRMVMSSQFTRCAALESMRSALKTSHESSLLSASPLSMNQMKNNLLSTPSH